MKGAIVSAKYRVTVEGYQATVQMPDGSTKYSNIVCRGDHDLLDEAMNGLEESGAIVGYTIEWVKKEVQA